MNKDIEKNRVISITIALALLLFIVYLNVKTIEEYKENSISQEYILYILQDEKWDEYHVVGTPKMKGEYFSDFNTYIFVDKEGNQWEIRAQGYRLKKID